MDLVEHVERSLIVSLVHCPGFLQQVWRTTVKEQEVADVALNCQGAQFDWWSTPIQPTGVGGVSRCPKVLVILATLECIILGFLSMSSWLKVAAS